MTIWFSTSKSQELIRFSYVQGACDIPLKISWQGLQLCFKRHFNRRSAYEVMGSQSHKSRNFGTLGVQGQYAIWMWASWRGIKYTIKGEGGGFPQVRAMVILVSPSCPWLVLAPNVFQLCINHLVFGFVQAYVNSWCLSLFLVPSQSSSTPLYLPPKCCEPIIVPCFLALLLFSI
jgi:hypothetical protein